MSHAPCVRSVAFLLSLAVVGAIPALAAGANVDPAALVLRQSDVPAGYRLNARLSGPRTTAQDSADFPELTTKYRSWGRLGGYQIRFDHGADSIVARADVFRSATGTRKMYVWF